MKLQTLRRGTAAAAVLTLSLTLAACGEDDEGGDATGTDTDTSETTPAEEEPPAEEPTEDTGGGEFDAVFGPACGEVPTSGDGSLEGMVDDPVATAASNNPLLSTLVAAVGAVEGLDGVLNDAPSLTVFAPYNGMPGEDGFAAIPEKDLNDLLAGAKKDGVDSTLATVLQHHVIGEELDPTAVVGEQETLIGDTLTVEGDPESGMTVSDGKVTANVLCGGVPTANATVYVIDQVMTNAMPTG